MINIRVVFEGPNAFIGNTRSLSSGMKKIFWNTSGTDLIANGCKKEF